jgi:hypothetical protein
MKDILNKRFLACFLLFALFAAQISISAHSAVHIDHNNIVVASADQSDHKDDHLPQDIKHKCPECLLVKSLQHAYFSDSIDLANLYAYKTHYSDSLRHLIAAITPDQYNARGPPVLI